MQWPDVNTLFQEMTKHHNRKDGSKGTQIGPVLEGATSHFVGDTALLSLDPRAHDHSLVTTSRHSTTHELALLAAYHPVWMSRHTRDSQQDTHTVHGCLTLRKAVDGSAALTDTKSPNHHNGHQHTCTVNMELGSELCKTFRTPASESLMDQINL